MIGTTTLPEGRTLKPYGRKIRAVAHEARAHLGKHLEIVKRRVLLPPGSLENWFLVALERQSWQGDPWTRSLNYYEFGTGWGGTLMKYIKALSLFCREQRRNFYDNHIFGFDSFEGLPPKKGFQDGNPSWGEGYFAHSVEDLQQKIRKYGVDLKQGNIQFIKGFFEVSLTSELRDKLKKWPPSIVTIDVDYYSSTKTVLKWLKPILSKGVLVYFDDVWDFYGHPKYGELGAINDFNEEGNGLLVPFPLLGVQTVSPFFGQIEAGLAYIFCPKVLEEQ